MSCIQIIPPSPGNNHSVPDGNVKGKSDEKIMFGHKSKQVTKEPKEDLVSFTVGHRIQTFTRGISDHALSRCGSFVIEEENQSLTDTTLDMPSSSMVMP